DLEARREHERARLLLHGNPEGGGDSFSLARREPPAELLQLADQIFPAALLDLALGARHPGLADAERRADLPVGQRRELPGEVEAGDLGLAAMAPQARDRNTPFVGDGPLDPSERRVARTAAAALDSLAGLARGEQMPRALDEAAVAQVGLPPDTLERRSRVPPPRPPRPTAAHALGPAVPPPSLDLVQEVSSHGGAGSSPATAR